MCCGRAVRVNQWTVTVVAPARWLTENNRRADPIAQGRDVAKWRGAMAQEGRRLNLPERVSGVTLFYDLYHTGRRPPVRDKLNINPTIKALTDGLGREGSGRGCGFLIDDSDRHVVDTDWAWHRSQERVPYVVLTIRKVDTA